jgi:hypothetical protein
MAILYGSSHDSIVSFLILLSPVLFRAESLEAVPLLALQFFDVLFTKDFS